MPVIIAHRGASADAPENTLDAFTLAHQQGARWIEFDVRTCGSDELVVFHDDELDRTTNGQGLLTTFTYPQLKKLDAGSWFSPQFNHAYIPTLTETLLLIQQLSLHANIELKPFIGTEKSLAKQTLTLIQQQFPTLTSQLLISSFDADSLYVVRQQDKNIAVGLLYEFTTPLLSAQQLHQLKKQVFDLNAYSLHINEDFFNISTLSALKILPVKLFAYTVNDAARYHELIDLGIDGVFTDFPQKLQQGK